jgi:CRISPR-associated protein Csx10
MAKHKGKKDKQKQSPQKTKAKANNLMTQNSSHPPDSLNILNEFSLKIEMLSDWHIGSGTGIAGGIDRLVRRDQNGLPYLPAKTITGVWRDACELLALGLDNGSEHGAWQKWVDYLFGDQPADRERDQSLNENTPRQAVLSVRSAHLPDSLINLLCEKDKQPLKDYLTFVKPSTSIDSLGCATEKSLRFEEMVRGGGTLEAHCEIQLELSGDDEEQQKKQRETALALLLVSTKLIERIGGKRRRGSGKCAVRAFSQQDIDLTLYINWLENNLTPPEVPKLPDEGKNIEILESKESQSLESWVQVQLDITTKSPVIVASRTVGNVVETLDYIPGTHLLRLVRRKLVRRKLNSLELDKEINGAIAQGHLLVTNATIKIGEHQGRAMPLCLFNKKSEGGFDAKSSGKERNIYNRLSELPPEDSQIKGERGGYLGVFTLDKLPAFGKVSKGIETHNVVNDRYQTPTSDGGVYSYEAIPQDTKLIAYLRVHPDLAAKLQQGQNDWYQLLATSNGKSDRIGQSKKDDYGEVEIRSQKLAQRSPELVVLKEKKELTVWLLSDILLRDKRLRPSTSIEDLASGLTDRSGTKITAKKDEKNDLLTLIARQNRIESWQVKWGLPRPSLVGLAAGTCAVFTYEMPPDPAKLAEIERTGIGDRIAEGYGQICFNDPLLTQATSNLPHSPKPDEIANPKGDLLANTNDPLWKYARIIEKAAWQDAIHRASLTVASSPDKRKQVLGIEGKHPPMSQLGSLRSVLAQLTQPESQNHQGSVTRWLDHLEETPNRRDKWANGSLDKIRTLISTPSQVWNDLELDFEKITLTKTGYTNLKEELWVEAVQTLVDACIRAHKRDLEKQDKSKQSPAGEA